MIKNMNLIKFFEMNDLIKYVKYIVNTGNIFK